METALWRWRPDEHDPSREHVAHLKLTGVHTRVTGGEHCSETVFPMGQHKMQLSTTAPCRDDDIAVGAP